jgi:alpha-methylacyl-CoA racemase
MNHGGALKGPLSGFKVVEVAGIGPGQLCGMLLADMGAQVIRVDRLAVGDLGISMPARFNTMNRSRPLIAVDLKNPEGVGLVLKLCGEADALFEGYRPGVMERLGLGPDVCLARNQRLVYGRMTGWGQTGPLANTVGHDTNYIAVAGALHCIGEADSKPPLPLNLIGDFGGGGLYLALGMLAALLEVSRSGQGQVVDAAMVDGTASMLTMFYGLLARGLWRDERGVNILDGGAPYAQTYLTQDDKFVAVCAVENRFYQDLLKGLGLDDVDAGEQQNPAEWPALKRRFADVFRSRTRDEWCEIFAGSDACFAPVLSLHEAPNHPHSVARGGHVEVDGIMQPAAAPRFSRTPSQVQCPPTEPGGENNLTLLEWGLTQTEIDGLCESGVLVP